MADATGLHPSQVYKWWWDQKKKNMKYEREALNKAAIKKKMIRKDYLKRPFSQSNSNIEEDTYQRAETKPKTSSGLAWESENAGTTINKRLSFA